MDKVRLRQIIYLLATDKSLYFAITEFNNCFIIRSPSLFLMNIFGKRSDLPWIFSRNSDRKKEIEKSVVSFTHEQNIICSQTQLDDIANEQVIICRQLFVAHVLAFWVMKRKTNLHRMIIRIKWFVGDSARYSGFFGKVIFPSKNCKLFDLELFDIK